MRSIILIIGIFFTILSGVILENRAQAQAYVNIDLFYEELSPYGGWSPHAEFGDVWQPYEVGPDWKPYSDGRWEWSDQGWIWISYEPWGWATYHYGRWVYDDYQGWIWIPGTTWAPAWVSWHQSPEYIGWAPLPPDRGFFVEIGINFNIYESYRYKPYHYKHRHKKHRYYHDYYYNPHHNYRPPARHGVFLPSHSFGHHKHAGKASVPNPQDAIVFRNSKNITNYKYSGNKVINHGPDKYYIEKRSNRKLVRHKIVNRHNVTLRRKENVNTVKGNTYNVYRPNIDRSKNQNIFIKTRQNITPKRSNGVRNERIKNSFNNNNYGKFSNKGFRSNNHERYDIQMRKNSLSKRPGVSNKTGNLGNSNFRNSAVNKKAYKTSPNGKNNFNKKLKLQTNSRLSEPGNKLRTAKAKKDTKKREYYKNNKEGRNSHKVKKYDKSYYGHKNQSINKSYQKTNKNNYTNKNKSSFNRKSNSSQRKSYNTTTRTMPTSNSRAFSKR